LPNYRGTLLYLSTLASHFPSAGQAYTPFTFNE